MWSYLRANYKTNFRKYNLNLFEIDAEETRIYERDKLLFSIKNNSIKNESVQIYKFQSRIQTLICMRFKLFNKKIYISNDNNNELHRCHKSTILKISIANAQE